MSVSPNAVGRVLWAIAVRRLMSGRLRQLAAGVKRFVEDGGL